MGRLSLEGDLWLGLRRCASTGVARLSYNRAAKVDATKKRSVLKKTHKVKRRIYFVKSRFLQGAFLPLYGGSGQHAILVPADSETS